MNSTRP